MIVTVTPNPALDLTWHVASLAVGSTHRADAGRARAGGKGLNVARVAAASGASVVAVTTVGGATGEEFAAELDAAGVPHVLVPVAASTRRSVALVDESLGDTTVVNEYGVAPSDAEWTALTDAVAAALRGGEVAGAGRQATGPREKPLRARDTTSAHASHAESGFSPGERGPEADAAADVLVISGSLPPGTPDDLLPALIRLGHDAGAAVIVDTSGPSLLVAADAGASVLKPNEHELRDATGLDDPIDGARELLRRGAELVLLSLGSEGILAVSAGAAGVVPNPGAAALRTASRATTRGTDADGSGSRDSSVRILRARLETPLAGNPTGAGDAAVAACAVLMDAGIHDPELILRRATAWSAAAVLMPLAGEIHASWPDLERALVVTPATPHPATPHPATPHPATPHPATPHPAAPPLPAPRTAPPLPAPHLPAETSVLARDMTPGVPSHAASEFSSAGDTYATPDPEDPR